MIDDTPIYLNDDAAAVPGLLAWLFWLRYWLMGTAGAARGAYAQKAPRPAGFVNRERRRIAQHMKRCGLPAQRNMAPLLALLPRGRSPAQKMEHLSKLSNQGRVTIYRMRYWAPTLLLRARLVCYDHGWWRAPFLRAALWSVCLRPP